MPRIAVCEDDPAIRRVVLEALRLAGHEAVAAHDGGEALRLFAHDDSLDVVVLDIGLPDADGRDVCVALRSAGQTAPVMFLTALGEIHEKLSGFRAGADDYLAKPFAVSELLARVDVLARRRREMAGSSGSSGPSGSSGSSGSASDQGPELVLDPARHSVACGGREVLLSPTEFRMLAAITSRPGEVVRRRVVVNAAWPDGAAVSENTVDSYVRRLRVKLDEVGSPVRIQTVRGVGLRLR